MSELDSKYFPEIKATGLDYIPRDCPGICNRIEGHEENIIVYGRRRFCARKKAAAIVIQERPPASIPIPDAMEIEKAGILDCKKTIDVLLSRQEQHEANLEALRSFAPKVEA